ncbi:MAG TPA: hypothetical protein VKW06_19455 [Candidatus Angelobacter sp.]|nr:hypothetical protein [Candidatus Angelobacter sp.]
MRLVKRLFFVVLTSSLLAAQSSPPADSDSSKIQKLLDAVAAQQKAIAEQQQQITQQQQEIEKLKQQLTPQPEAASNEAQLGRAVNASLTIANPKPAARNVSDVAEQDQPKESPLSFKIGGAEFTPGGFMDFTAIFRSTNTGNPGGTGFAAIPFSNTIGGHLTETRFTAQNSRVSLKATDKFGANDVTGYVEMDFLGNDAGNVFVTSNSHTVRQRLYFVDVKRNKWEILAGQSWSWLTPNRSGLSPYPSDVFYSQDMDFNYQAGLTWTRAPQFRVAYHANDQWALGVALENPQQYIGAAGVTFPTAFNAQLGGQFDANSAGSTGNAVPNLHPDIIPKIAYDTNMGGRHFHVEAAGLLTGIKITNLSGGTFVKHTKEAGGLEGAINLEVVKNVRIVANGFWSDGGGRYVFGMGPDSVVLPNAAGTDLALSLIHSYSGIFGFEAQVTPHTMLYGYYGGAYFQRSFAIDTTSTAVVKPFVGFGGPNSANSANRAIQEPTFGWIQTFWKNPQYGALQLITQASYLTRAPWFVAAGAPKNAHLAMGWVDLRYVLP